MVKFIITNNFLKADENVSNKTKLVIKVKLVSQTVNFYKNLSTCDTITSTTNVDVPLKNSTPSNDTIIVDKHFW